MQQDRTSNVIRRRRAGSTATRKHLGAILMALVSLGAAPVSAAAADLINIGVILDEPAVEVAVIEALDGRGYRVIRGTDLRARAAAEGIKPGLPPGTRALARSMGLSGIIGGVIRPQAGKPTAFMVLSDGASGEIVFRARWAAPSMARLGATVRKEFWRQFGPSIRALVAVPGATISPQPPGTVPAPPPPGQPGGPGPRRGSPPVPSGPPSPPPPSAPIPPGYAPTQGALPSGGDAGGVEIARSSSGGNGARQIGAEVQPEAEVSGTASASGDAPGPVADDESGEDRRLRRQVPLFELALGMRLHSRSLSYDNDPDNSLASYRAAVAPGLAGSLTTFPLRRWVPLGLQVAGESTARIASELPRDLTYSSRNIEVQGSAVLELTSRWLVVQVLAGGGLHRFSFVPAESAKSRPRPVPDVFYQYLRGGANLQVVVSPRFGVEAGAFYRHVLHPGEIRARDWFPRDKAFALELGAGVSYRLTRQLEARTEVQVRRYQHDLNTRPGDLRNSAGAVDQHISAGLALAWAVGAGPLR